MKHHRILYRALSALLCLGLCAQLTACGKKPVPKPGSSGPSAPSVSKKVYDDSLITEVYDEEDSFTDEYGTEYSYICHVPQLEADTPEAKAINWEIMESFGNDVQATLDAAESGETPNSQYMEVTWQSYWNDSLLSLSIRVLGWTSDLIDYAVYHYDFETGQRPDNLELLDRFHVDEGDFIAALRRGAARQFDSHYAPWGTGGLSPEDENYGGISIDLAALRAWTVAEENFSLDLARFCPNGDGTFTAFQPVASIAGGSRWYYEPVLVEPGPGDWRTAALRPRTPLCPHGSPMTAYRSLFPRASRGISRTARPTTEPTASRMTRSTPWPGATATIRTFSSVPAGRISAPMCSS